MLSSKAFLMVLLGTANMCLGSGVKPWVTANDTLKGVFTKKGKKEYATLISPPVTPNQVDCPGGCVSIIKFLDKHVPELKIDGSIGGTFTNLGDLDGDGLDEIGFLPEWFNGCWREYKVYTFKNGQWVFAVPPFPTHCNQWEANVQPIIKDPAKKGNVIITYSVFGDNDIVFKNKSIPIK